MSARNWLYRFMILALLSAALGSGAVGCQSTGGFSGTGSDGHAGHSH